MFERWQRLIDAWIREYGKLLDRVLDHRWATVIVAYAMPSAVLLLLTMPIRREFFPQADAGAFEIYVRAPAAPGCA